MTASDYAPLPPSPYGRLLRDGHPWIWMTRCFTAVLLLMVAGIIAIVLVKGLSTFWPRRLTRFEMKDGSVVVGEEIRREVRTVGADSRDEEQVFLRVGNRDQYGSGADFRWIVAADVRSSSEPEDLLSFERMEYGPAYGRVRRVTVAAAPSADGRPGGPPTVTEGGAAVDVLRREIRESVGRREARLEIQEGELAEVSRSQNDLNNQERRFRATTEPEDPSFQARSQEFERRKAALEAEYARISARSDAISAEDRRHLVLLEDGAGKAFKKPLPVSQILRMDEVNRATWLGRVGMFFGRIWRFVSERPREANTDGGIWPAIFGTMLMTLIMSIFVVPFGVVAALYLREYAKQGPMISAVRIAVNNLAGVPSIVFGVFGLGFFCYLVGGFIDRHFFAERLPTPTYGGGGILWASLTLALLTVPVVIVATEEALAAVPRALREAAIACGASKWQMIRRVVLPHASPGILTGAILAMARGAGEVAPLVLTGVIKLANDLPVDAHPPYLHPDRRFMHIGFSIYDSGFQSPNVDATTPLVYSETLVLLVLVLCLNFGAIVLRNRLRKKFKTGAF